MHRLEMSDPRELSGHVTASLSTSSLPTIDVRTIASGARHHGPFGPEASQAGLRDMEPPPLFSNGVSRYSLLDGDNHARSAFAWMLEPSPRGGRDGSPNPADRLSAAHLHAAQDVLERRLDLRLELRDLLPAHEDSISLVEFEELLQRWEPPSKGAEKALRGVGAGGRNGGALTR